VHRTQSADQHRSLFDAFAERSSQFVSTGPFFGLSALLVLLWLPTIFVIPSVDTWQLVLNTVVSVLAFLLVALLQNSEHRNDQALHQKLDAVAAGLADLMEHGTGADRRELEKSVVELRDAVGLQERI
jgi:low affinity Fe/Cu permease